MATAARVFSGYRRLFRARKILFQGDERAMRESRIEIRKNFDMNRAASDPAHIEGLLTMVDEAEDMILHGIVRGELNDQTGNYGELLMDQPSLEFVSPTHHVLIFIDAFMLYLLFVVEINHKSQRSKSRRSMHRTTELRQKLTTWNQLLRKPLIKWTGR